ncbi:hypothetical protein H0R92_12665 [Treponema sp. OMZ 840]|uniref:hypothetical protein n=1 Tax=Treponema sp. OMZ 840 TaxID=244313 RepID=UPI003D93EEC2
MKTSMRTFILILVYTLFAFAFFIAKAFFIKELPQLFSADMGLWRFITGLSEFLYWLPAILASVCCIAFSWSFAKGADKNLARFSPVQVRNYKIVLISSVISVVLCFIGAEVLLPLTAAKKNRLENKVQDYHWYFEQARISLNEGNAAAAGFYADNALALAPDNPDAKELKAETQRLSAQGAPKRADVSALLPSDIAAVGNTPYSVMMLLEKARTAFAAKNFFDAHYYAWWGLKLAGDNDENSGNLRRLAVESWNIISSWSGFETDEAARIFLKKREGYAALIEGDVLSAYYIFLDLYAINDFDPDIRRFYKLSIEALLRQYFFIDETQNLAFFEDFKNVTFRLKHPDGKTDVINIGGVTTVAKTDNFVKYLRNYSCLSYAPDGHLISSMSVPYAKLIGQQAGSLGIDFVKRTGVQEPETYVPQLLLTSIDRKNRGVISSPRYLFMQEGMHSPDIVQILPMSLQDFDLVCRASSMGPLYMNLAFLFRFVPLAERYGMPQRIYSLFLLQRFCRPLLLFILFIFLAVIAWDYKLEDSQVFRFVWIFGFPIFTVVIQFCIEFLRYLMNLIYYALTTVTALSRLPVAFAFLFLIIVFISLRFLSLYKK